jgi:hypothetical protein
VTRAAAGLGTARNSDDSEGMLRLQSRSVGPPSPVRVRGETRIRLESWERSCYCRGTHKQGCRAMASHVAETQIEVAVWVVVLLSRRSILEQASSFQRALLLWLRPSPPWRYQGTTAAPASCPPTSELSRARARGRAVLEAGCPPLFLPRGGCLTEYFRCEVEINSSDDLC